MVDEPYDLVAKPPDSDSWLKIQCKTIRVRNDRRGQLVVYARKGNGDTYKREECDYIVGVHGDDTYLILNREISEYWKPEIVKEGYEWTKLSG